MIETLKNKSPYFDKQMTGILKGIALIMMFLHHFFTFPSWWGEGISYPLIEKFAPYFCIPLKLCVSVFCFITGYFYYFNNHHTYKYSLKKITDILISYWSIFLIFSFIAALFADYDFTLSGIIEELFAVKTPTMIFCWYVNFYIIFMLILPLITRIMGKNSYVDIFIIFFAFQFVLRLILHFLKNEIIMGIIDNLSLFFPVVLIGYFFASYDIFEKVEKINKRIIKNRIVNMILMFIVAIAVPFGRYVEPNLTLKFVSLPSLSTNLDVLYAPIFIYCIVNICKVLNVKPLKYILSEIGKYSMIMWFVSCIFFNNSKDIFQPILYLPHNPLLVTIWGLLICFGVSYILDKCIKKIQNFKNKIIFS